MKPIHPVTLELIRNRLIAGAKQMAVTLWKSSYSTVVREVLDYSTALFDAQGRMVAQSAQLPFQMMTMSSPLQYLLETGLAWEPGDAVLLNDPYLAQAQHLPDFMIFSPIFVGDEHVAFAGAVAHMIDTGGGAPGSYLASATEIFQEGLRLPPIKVMRKGEPNHDLFDIIAANVREPDKTLGDVRAMLASLPAGSEAVQDLVNRYGAEQLSQGMDALLDASDILMRQGIAEAPDGEYEAVDFVDDDGITSDPIRIQVKLTIAGDGATVDFTGSSPQARGPVNATLSMTHSTVNYIFMAALASGTQMNDGCNRAIHIIAPPGSIVNALHPAPVASRVTTCHRIVDAMLQALANAIPDRVMAGYYGMSNICSLSGLHADTRQPWVHFEVEVGGWGGRPCSDGLDAYSAHIHNLANVPAEVVESTQPLRVECYALRPDTGGKGKHRGGLGLRRDIRALQDDVMLNLLSDRSAHPPPGILGGEAGSAGRYVLNPETSDETRLPNKLSNFLLKKNDVISIQTQGGGGYGPAAERDPRLLERDRVEEKMS